MKGKTIEEAQRIIDDAWSLVEAGVFALVVEHVSPELMAHITKTLPVPTFSLGSGPNADGVTIVSGDVLNYSAFTRPAHAGQFADLRSLIAEALRAYAARARDGSYPTDRDAPRMAVGELAKLKRMLAGGSGKKGKRQAGFH